MGIILLRLLMRSDSPQEWLSFRGPGAAGVADGQRLPDVWHGAKGFQIKWKTEIPGLAHSSPIVWGDRIFVTTAVSSRPNATFKPGFYGDGTASDDLSVHRWQVISLDRKSGKILWTKTAFEGQPKERRHIKSTYASSSPATNGRVVVALFGSQGLLRIRLCGEAALEEGFGAHRCRRLRCTGLRVGNGKFTDHSRGQGDRAVRSAEELTPARCGHQHRRDAMES